MTGQQLKTLNNNNENIVIGVEEKMHIDSIADWSRMVNMTNKAIGQTALFDSFSLVSQMFFGEVTDLDPVPFLEQLESLIAVVHNVEKMGNKNCPEIRVWLSSIHGAAMNEFRTTGRILVMKVDKTIINHKSEELYGEAPFESAQ